MKLGRYLFTHRIKHEAFATQIGVSRVSVSHWVNGRQIPSQRKMVAISRVTWGAVTPEDFRGDSKVTRNR